MNRLWSEFRITGYEIPEHGGAGYPAVICVRCGVELLEADGRRRPELERVADWGDTMGLDRALGLVENHLAYSNCFAVRDLDSQLESRSGND